jgi:DNA-binding HxlR family transcriptional regulator
MLTQTLRGLERDGLVTRTVHATVPPRVDYELTELGRTLSGPIAALEKWALDHMAHVLAAREAYDARRAQPVS